MPTPMPTLTPPADAATARRLWTVADVAVLPEQLPSGPAGYELLDGELMMMAPPGDLHGAVQSNLIADLKVQGERAGHGRVRSEVGVVIARDPDTVLTPDACFIAASSLPLRRSPEGYLESIPQLIVEVRSKNDSLPEIERKVQLYLTAGSVVVWVVDPFARQVREYRPGQPLKLFAPTDSLTAPDLIPGFSVPVGTIFAE